MKAAKGSDVQKGIVVDKATNLPLDSVLVEVIAASTTIYTDTSGNFNVCNRMSGCVTHCKDIIVKFSKSAYQRTVLTNPDDDVVVLMDK